MPSVLFRGFEKKVMKIILGVIQEVLFEIVYIWRLTCLQQLSFPNSKEIHKIQRSIKCSHRHHQRGCSGFLTVDDCVCVWVCVSVWDGGRSGSRARGLGLLVRLQGQLNVTGPLGLPLGVDLRGTQVKGQRKRKETRSV